MWLLVAKVEFIEKIWVIQLYQSVSRNWSSKKAVWIDVGSCTAVMWECYVYKCFVAGNLKICPDVRLS